MTEKEPFLRFVRDVVEDTVVNLSLDQFAYAHCLTVVVREIGRRGFMAYIEGAEVKDGGLLISARGHGNTCPRAVADYVDQISERVIVLDAYKESRREIRVPRLRRKRR